MCICVYASGHTCVYMYWRKLTINNDRKPSSPLPLLQRTTVNTWLLFFPFTMSSIY